MCNYFIFVIIASIYAIVSLVLSLRIYPRSVVGLYWQFSIQFVVLTLCCLVPCWWPVNSVIGWIAWYLCCFVMYACFALQMSTARLCVIDKEKVYDFHVDGIRYIQPVFRSDGSPGIRCIVGHIKEGPFVTPVILICRGREEKHGAVVKVKYNAKDGHFKKPTAITYYDDKYQKNTVMIGIIVTKVEA